MFKLLKLWDELTILLSVVTVVWLLFFKRRTDRWLVRWLEKGKLSPTPAKAEELPKAGAIFFPVATSVGLGLVAGLLLIMSLATVRHAIILIFFGSAAITVVAVPALSLAVLYCHYAGVGSRRLKYELTLTTACVIVPMFSSGNLVGDGLMVIIGNSDDQESWQQLFLVIGAFEALFGIYLVAVQYAAYAIVRFAAKRHRESKLYSYFQSHITWVIAVFCSPYLIAHTLIRYHLVPLLGQKPILFFRSFHSEMAQRVFAQLVAKAARRVGIVEGLVHISQPASALQERLDLSEQAHFDVSTTEDWQDWVLQRLARASAVVVDMSDNSQNLAWEIAMAIEKVGAAHVALLYARGFSLPSFPEGVWSCAYTLNRKDLKRARRELQFWLRATQSSTDR